MSDWEEDEDLLDLMENEDLFEETIVYAETTSKAFANEHSIEIGLVDKDVYNNINLDITEDEFFEIIEKYSDYLWPVRKQMIQKLVIQRYENIKKLANK
ncbi:hypothetical protein MXL46_17675 [Heyndrickxia sporothermodurans]|uniref:hypothetical protein n=1 Tax=Heyndrickxia TaxID=2837504 RepID=UPI000D392C26|nr:hypothetical protein [Heyndrickxia sporothermodurans]MEB6550893.1 hypothetical protein [Heyndrickxia sporothermodurans]MED3651939.1 hypothetical protein [Heyndrickxia sporothermodurans]MED3655275.1 hypothetical protein [Heyndrickxia sporothermodurans]MED3698281.1 hypothetical protein [Heyndrickxia sporothermodurans]MED3782478.1 hypothetical protein [Heyndrickxia sporothermodurans]